jgi:hypothetical protein
MMVLTVTPDEPRDDAAVTGEGFGAGIRQFSLPIHEALSNTAMCVVRGDSTVSGQVRPQSPATVSWRAQRLCPIALPLPLSDIACSRPLLLVRC